VTPSTRGDPCWHGTTIWRKNMAKGKRKLEVVHLVCEETGDLNYTLRRKTGGEKLKVKKYSPRLRKHTLHNEKRK
jgi:large subunit ribosomal protein L33